jgi:predicted nucleic acid-binding protein
MAVEMLLSELDIGEAETIVLAREQKADLIILDNREPRRVAKSLSINVIGTIGILKYAHTLGLIRKFKDILDEIRLKGFWISQDLYNEILKK